MEAEIGKALLVYGPLGITTLVSLAVAAKLYRDLSGEREKHAKEMTMFQERYVAKAETWMKEYHELAKSLNDVLESMSKRYGRG